MNYVIASIPLSLTTGIHWNPDPEIINLFGIHLKYYGLLWAIGLLLATYVVHSLGHLFRGARTKKTKIK